MPTNVLGISCFYHDAAAALLRDGRVIAAAQEERFTRKKHDYGFPQNAIDYCLREAGIGRSELDLVVFYDGYNDTVGTVIGAAVNGVDESSPSMLVTEEHLVPKAKYPVVDIHSHQRATAENMEELIAEMKKEDLNANDVEMAMRMIAGTARSMGITVRGEV